MAPSPGTDRGLSPPLERPCLQNCPAALWYFHKKINKTQPTDRNQNPTATKQRRQNPQTRTKPKKDPNKQHP